MRHIVRVNLLAVIVGTIVGLLGSAFFFCIGHGYALLLTITRPDAMGAVPGWAIGAVIGAALVGLSVVLTHRFAPETTGSGIHEIEGTLSGLRPPLRWRRIIPVKFTCGVLAMASGMILGREGPTIHMGGAVGAAVAALSKADDYDGKALVAAAAGAGLAVAFNAPLGGILFVVEELRDKFSITPIVLNGVIVASLAASITGIFILDPGRLLPITVYDEIRWHDLALAVPLAAILGVYAALFNASITWAQDALRVVAERIGRLPIALLIGGTIGALAGLLPEATGGGEALTLHFLTHPPAMFVLFFLLLLRTLLFPLCYAAGTPGGIFAPQLAAGTLLGLLYAEAVTAFFPGLITEPAMFAVAAMAGLLAATVGAPLTGAVLIAEMTGNYLLLPMMLVCSAVASVVAGSLGSRPIYDILLERALRFASPATPVEK